jgi:hypothetical protein
MSGLVYVTFVILCVAWPMIGLGILFLVDAGTAKGMLTVVFDIFISIFYKPRGATDINTWTRRLNQVIGVSLILAGLLAGWLLLRPL